MTDTLENIAGEKNNSKTTEKSNEHTEKTLALVRVYVDWQIDRKRPQPIYNTKPYYLSP